MTRDKAYNILVGYVKAYKEDDFLTLEGFNPDDVIEAMRIGGEALSETFLPSEVCRVKADYDSHGADYGVRFLRIDLPDDTPVGEKFIVKIIPKNL